MTIHLNEGRSSLAEILKEKPASTSILGVTVLTSTSYEDFSDIGIDTDKIKNSTELVIARARTAKEEGVNGIVCSPLEVRAVKEALGADFCVITPGVRLADDTGADDQKRTATPSGAVANGADYIVVGRPIRDAKDPARVAELIAADIAQILT